LNQQELDNIQPQASLLWMILGLIIALLAIELGTAMWSHGDYANQQQEEN
jgi:hypothetical protein